MRSTIRRGPMTSLLLAALLPYSWVASALGASSLKLPPGYDPVTYSLIDGFTPAALQSCAGEGPDFAQAARAGLLNGFVAVRWTVGADGKVRDVRPEGPWVKPGPLTAPPSMTAPSRTAALTGRLPVLLRSSPMTTSRWR